MIIQWYECDTCHRRSEGTLGKLPHGWCASRWRPGILASAKGKPALPGDRHYCSTGCYDTDEANRQREMDALHASFYFGVGG